MPRMTWLFAAVASVLVTACVDPLLDTVAEPRSPRLASLSGDEVLQPDLQPSKGDIVGLGGSLIGQFAAGVPGGALLGFGGQVAGGNQVGKAVGSTLGALVGSVLGPVGSVIGSLVGGYAGDRHGSDDTEATLQAAAPGAAYIDDLDLGRPREKSS